MRSLLVTFLYEGKWQQVELSEIRNIARILKKKKKKTCRGEESEECRFK